MLYYCYYLPVEILVLKLIVLEIQELVFKLFMGRPRSNVLPDDFQLIYSNIARKENVNNLFHDKVTVFYNRT